MEEHYKIVQAFPIPLSVRFSYENKWTLISLSSLKTLRSGRHGGLEVGDRAKNGRIIGFSNDMTIISVENA